MTLTSARRTSGRARERIATARHPCVVDGLGGTSQHALGHLALEDVEPGLLVLGATVRAGEVDELLRHEALTHGQGHRAAAITDPEDEALARRAEVGAGQRGVHDVAALGGRTGDQLEGIARARSAEGGLDRELAALGRGAGIEQRPGALHHSHGVSHATG